jgi:Cft2 family RNA processing exonuclease
MLRVTPLYGAESHHPDSKLVGALPPNGTLVEYAGVRLLVNVGSGSGESLTDKVLEQVHHHNIDAILLSDSTMESLGGLPRHFAPSKQQSKKGETTASNKKKKIHIPPIYATYPTLQLGPMTLYDHHANISLDGGNPGYSLDDVDALFAPSESNVNSTSSEEQEDEDATAMDVDADEDMNGNVLGEHDDEEAMNAKKKAKNANRTYIRTLKYSQSILLAPKSKKRSTKAGASLQIKKQSNSNEPVTQQVPTLSITPHRSGHVIGGAYWVLQRLSDETTIVLCPSGAYNPSRELHLDSSSMSLHARAPDAMVIRPGGMGGGLLGSLYKGSPPVLQPQPWRTVQSSLLDQIMSVLRRNGNVLLPTDAAGRVLELLLLLDGYWRKQRLSSTYHLVWVGPMAHNVLAYVQSQLEWMNGTLGKQFDSGATGKGGGGGGNPFALSCVTVCSTTQEVEELERQGLPMVVVASGGGGGINGCDCGPARDWLVRWGEEQDNAIFFTDAQMCSLRSSHSSNGNVLGNAGMPGDNTKKSSSFAPNPAQQRDSANNKNSQRNLLLDNNKEDPSAAAGGAEGEAVQGSNLPVALNASDQSAAAQLLRAWCEAKTQHREMADEIAIDVLVPTRRRLEGEELAQFTHEEEEALRKRVAEEERVELLKEVELARGRLHLGEDDLAKQQKQQAHDDGAAGGDVGQGTSALVPRRRQSSQGAGSKQTTRRRKKFDSNLFLKYSKPLFMTFPDQEEAVGIGQDPVVAKFGIAESLGSSNNVLMDDYGIAVKADKFHDLVTGSDAAKYSTHGGGTGRLADDALFNRRGGGGLGAPGKSGATGGDGDEEKDSEMDETSMEIVDLSEGNGIIRGRSGRPPTKVYTVARKLEVLAEVSYVPLEGRVSARAGRQTVRALQPRQLVILGGATPPPSLTANNQVDGNGKDAASAVVTDDESNMRSAISKNGGSTAMGEAQLLADAVKELTMQDRKSIWIPNNCETVELSVGHSAYSVRLIDTPMSIGEELQNNAETTNANEQDSDDEDADEAAAGVQGDFNETKVGQYNVCALDCVATGQKVAADGSIVLAPRKRSKREETDHRRPAIMLSDGEVLLTDLRGEFLAQGMKAEYSTFTGYQQLLVNGRILIRKDLGSGHVAVEGPLCQDYFFARSVVCSQYTTI